jgi:hypothetical protein
LLAAHPQVGAVAFATANTDGSPWALKMQPAPVSFACYVPCFIGFATPRRDVFLRLGGYRESFISTARRTMSAPARGGIRCVYLPLSLVVHAAHTPPQSLGNIRHKIRNDCLGALYNEPFPLAFVSVPLRLRRYVQMRGSRAADPGGLTWIVTDLMKKLPSVLRDRRPVRWSTLRRWRRLRRQWPAWTPPAAMQQATGPAINRAERTIVVGITSFNRHERLRDACLRSRSLAIW